MQQMQNLRLQEVLRQKHTFLNFEDVALDIYNGVNKPFPNCRICHGPHELIDGFKFYTTQFDFKNCVEVVRSPDIPTLKMQCGEVLVAAS